MDIPISFNHVFISAESDEKLLEYAALAECSSSHPISKSLQKAYGKPIDRNRVTDIEEISGNGVTAKVDGCDCEETLKLIAEGKINTEPLITHTYPLSRIEEAYELFENKRDGVIKVAVEC